MAGTSIARALVLGALAGALVLGGCTKGKDSETAVDEKRERPLSSGTVSLRGMYSYMADAGVFVDCATQERWPVAMEGDNAALERAYGRAKVEPGSPLLVTVEGRLESRSKVDARGTETNLIVKRFVRTWPGGTCSSMTEATLEDTYWALIELNGKPVFMEGNKRAPYLELNKKKASAYGFAGCNRFFGTYEATNRSLRIGELGATRMACPEGMQREQDLFTALTETTRYEIDGSKLLLFSDDGLVARFEARDRPEE